MRIHGDPGKVEALPQGSTPEFALRFHGWVGAPGPLQTECWIWQGAITRYGYGKLNVGAKSWSAHRLSYTVWVGDIPDGLLVRHKCDVRSCINPEHLEVGTHLDNYEDMVSRGRRSVTKPENAAFTVLDWDKVEDIRDLYISGCTQSRIAEKYGVDRATIGYVVRGDTWVR